MKAPAKDKIAAIEARNIYSARIILANAERYGGEGSLMVQVARATVSRAEKGSRGAAK